MRPPSTPTGNNGNSQRARTRGAIRTHLGRKRTGPRNRMLKHSTLDHISEIALDAAFDGLVGAGEFTAENGERLRQYLRRDLLHRDNPSLTFRTGDITSAGTLSCAGCNWTIITTRTTVLPPCPQCSETAFRKTE